MESKQYRHWLTPPDNDERVIEIQKELAAMLGVPVTKVSKSGVTLRYLLDTHDIAKGLGIQAEIRNV